MSGRKNFLRQFQNILAGDMSTASLTSSVTDLQTLDNIGIELVWTGSPVGNFQIQVSADYVNNSFGTTVATAGHWVPLVLTYWTGSVFVTSTDVPTSLGSPIYLDLALLSAPFIRVVYTKTSGTGSLTSTITGKAI